MKGSAAHLHYPRLPRYPVSSFMARVTCLRVCGAKGDRLYQSMYAWHAHACVRMTCACMQYACMQCVWVRAGRACMHACVCVCVCVRARVCVRVCVCDIELKLEMLPEYTGAIA